MRASKNVSVVSQYVVSGFMVDKNVYSQEGGTIDLKNVKLIRLKDPQPGVWQVCLYGHNASPIPLARQQ